MGTRIEDHLGSQQVARVVYGAIIGMALIVVLEHHPPSAGVTTATLFATAVAVALAELYSDWIGHVLKHRTRFPPQGTDRDRQRRRARSRSGSCSRTSSSCWPRSACSSSTRRSPSPNGPGSALITFYGYAAGRLSGESRKRAALQALAVTAIGVALIGFKALVH